MLKNAAAIKNIQGIELVGTWDVSPGNVKQIKKALKDSDLSCVSIIPDIFSEQKWKFGSFSSKDKKIRNDAANTILQTCEMAYELDCPLLNIWPGQDGYDYFFQADFSNQRTWLTEGIFYCADRNPKLRFSLEYKPKEPRTHSFLSRMADTLLICIQTGLDNVGVTMDTGHSFVAGENLAEAAVMAQSAGNKLFHLHFNDNYKTWDDDMITGSVHTSDFLELCYWLDKSEYTGWYSMDQYPYRENAKEALEESISWLNFFHAKLKTKKKLIDSVIRKDNAAASSKAIREILK